MKFNQHSPKVQTDFLLFAKSIGAGFVVTHGIPNSLPLVLEGVRSGVYVQLRHDGSLYVGEAIDVVARQQQHYRRGVRFCALAVIAIEAMEWDVRYAFETKVIRWALQSGWRVANREKIYSKDRLRVTT